ncbi:MAG: carbamoyltransferase HypF, partial [Dehalococcoidia bacterium]|nr:carbamoyltransferase HypF [Dehalococcoidia bacterium]
MTETVGRASISVRGIVQGVGFRPFVYQLAQKYGLAGWVLNTSEDVRIELEGERQRIQEFLQELRDYAPPAAKVADISTTWIDPIGETQFEIRLSQTIEGKYQLVSPDIATCGACVTEIFDPDNRRFYYPFTNCTNCGPRFTIIEDMPYDRPRTTMRRFTMCPDCQREYDDPRDRRFHAQPNACPKCGPSLKLLDAGGKPVETTNIIGTAARLLKSRKIIALKGLGGFLLACHAQSETAVLALRQRKKRPSKPFAVMFPNLEQIEEHCEVSHEEARALTSPESPIVLLRWKQTSNIAQAVAPRLRYLGVMLPYTPLHHLLMYEMGAPLVMTSGNISEEPIARDNEEALKRLSDIADYFIIHNRDICSRYDDSVVMVERGEVQILRRARGYAPNPIHLNFRARSVLACGAEEKVTFCMTRDNYAFVSQHIGDMENMETMEHFQDTLALYKRLFRLEPEAIAHDLHPDYMTTKYACELADRTGLKLIPV